MSRSAGSDGPEDVDATFEEIVADLRAEGFGSYDTKRATDLPSEADTDPATGPEPDDRASSGSPDSGGWRDSPARWDDTMFSPTDPLDADDDEHYVPPEPPPLPKPRRGAFIVLLFFVVGLLLLIAPNLLGLNDTVGTPIGMLALATGIALLLLRVRQGPPDGADPSNGAQV